MANEQNLIDNSRLTPSERRESASRAGKASGRARRKKADLRKAFETILQANVSSKETQKQLESLGFDSTNEMALAMVMMQKAMTGDVRAFEQIAKITSMSFYAKDDLDRKEQKQRIKSLELENEKRRQQLAGNVEAEDAMAEYFERLQEVLTDGQGAVHQEAD